jgi:uncharacterized protein involved in exopolysaccharide biosynthesis
MRHSDLAGWLLCIGLAMPALGYAELYRYVDDRGVTVLDRQGVPPEFVGKGYEVLNEQGRVVKSVPPAPSAKERELRQAQALQSKADRRLMRLYASVADVDRARDRKLAELDSLIGVAKSNLQSVRLQQGNVLSQAAEFEKTGREVPKNLVNQMKDLNDEQVRLGGDIKRYGQTRVQTEKNFAADRLRVQELLSDRD